MTSTTSYAGEEIDQTSYGLEFLPVDLEPKSQEPLAAMSKPEPAKQEMPGQESAQRNIECLCPFCGAFNTQIGKPCPTCQTTDSTRTREASTQRTGPWYLLQPGNPDLPGVNFDDLLVLIRNQQVTADTVLRGPTTGQLWRLASRVRGVSREFGQCYNCAGDIKKNETLCPHCDRTQTVPEHADAIRPIRSASKPTFRPAVPPAVAVASRGPVPAAKPIEPSIPVSTPPVSTPLPESAPARIQRLQNLLEDPESPREVRDALLTETLAQPHTEPVVHVHSLSHREPAAAVDPIVTARPVVAESSEPHYPKDDLLTPRDLAKAFQLEFGPKANARHRLFTKPSRSMRHLRLALTGAAGLAFAGMLLWPLAKPAWDWMNDNRTRTLTPAAPVIAAASPANASHSDAFAMSAGMSPAMSPAQQPIFPAPTAPPIVAGAILTPTIVPDPEPATSAQDDPQVLWNAALDAEATGHFAAAVWAYERIQSLPSFSWPADLEVRLSLARKELKGDGR